GVIFWFHLFAKLFKIDFAKEEAERAGQFGEEAILSKTYRVTNPALEGQSVEKMLQSFGRTGFVLSRIKRGDTVEVVEPTTVLSCGDFIVAVGTVRSQEIARILFGEEAPEHIEERRDGMSYRRIFVSSREVIGKTIDQLRYEHPFQGAITRLRRGDVEIVPKPETILERGDRILVVSRRERADEIAAIFGDSIKSISEADFLSLSLGIVIGVLVGMIPIPLGGGMSFKLGFAGGPLVVGLILGRLERTGPIIWGMPFNANLVVRQIGLVFFLAAIGTRAGTGFAATFESGGVSIILAGALITTGVTCAAMLLAYRYLKLPFSAVMGMMSGIQTQPACLAYANERTENEMPNTWYATVYPAAMIAKIILAQVIVSVLLAAGG
ncbi:MAG TPA: TrkA C-terminal domain-containing protein, partial [candidate division Zixibacteria bacterium]|nr:TrkA C-terminal domain-containing protein [candidate division Zixibacteria bacterium]